MQTESKKRIKNDWFTPSQILERNPKIKNFYSAQKLGYLLMCQVISEKKLTRGCLISESSLLEFLSWRFGFNAE